MAGVVSAINNIFYLKLTDLKTDFVFIIWLIKSDHYGVYICKQGWAIQSLIVTIGILEETIAIIIGLKFTDSRLYVYGPTSIHWKNEIIYIYRKLNSSTIYNRNTLNLKF